MKVTLEEHGPEIVLIKGIHSTIEDAISRLGYDPTVNQTAESYFTTKVNKNSKGQSKTKLASSLKYNGAN
jgi:hypothetical protein